MTEKIYDVNPRTLDFTATVLSCKKEEKSERYAIILDRTAFFPEEGGRVPTKAF